MMKFRFTNRDVLTHFDTLQRRGFVLCGLMTENGISLGTSIIQLQFYTAVSMG